MSTVVIRPMFFRSAYWFLFLRSTMTRIELMRGKTPVFPELTLR
jgi:hypothetical protein